MKVRYIALLLACAPLLAHAGDEDGHWYINPYGGGIVPDNKWDTHSTFVGGIDLGKNWTPAWSTELDINTANPGDKGGTGSTRLSAASLDVLRVFNRGNLFAPFIDLGLGAVKPDIPHVYDSTEFMGQAGVGAFIKMWENADDSASFSLRPEVKVRSDRFTESGSRTDLLYVLGFTYSFGKGHPVPMAAAAAPPPPPPAAAPCAGTGREVPGRCPRRRGGQGRLPDRRRHPQGRELPDQLGRSHRGLETDPQRCGQGTGGPPSPAGGDPGPHRQHRLQGLQHGPFPAPCGLGA